MNITFACPKCDQTVRVEFDERVVEVGCPQCGYELAVPAEAVQQDQVQRCLVCPSTELFIRKDFSQGLGLTIIVLGFLASTVAWFYYMKYLTFAILLATALIDVVLYLVMGNVLQCYRCHAQYRGLAGMDQHGQFSLEVHERHRQQVARLDAEGGKVAGG